MKKSSDREKKKVLSLDETVELMGANPPEDIGELPLDPLGLQFLASRVGERLASKRGRPTDRSWDIVRKIPMKQATWDSLKEIAKQLGAEEVHVAPGQMGAIALERGLEVLRHESRADAPPHTGLATDPGGVPGNADVGHGNGVSLEFGSPLRPRVPHRPG